MVQLVVETYFNVGVFVRIKGKTQRAVRVKIIVQFIDKVKVMIQGPIQGPINEGLKNSIVKKNQLFIFMGA